MGEILATGPMKVPGRITGDPVGAPPDVVHVSIKNPTAKDFEIQLFAEVCNSTGPESIFPDTVQTVPSNSCLTRTYTFGTDVQPGDILRFFARGDLDEDGEKLELSFVGQRTSDQMNEPTMFFRHSDLIESENNSFLQDALASLTALSINPWGN